MERLLTRALRAVALVGVTLALAACSTQTPERETGSTAVLGSDTGAVQISQPVTTVGGLGVARAVIPAQDLVTPAQETTAKAGAAIQQTTTVATEAVEAPSALVVGPT